MTSIDENDIEIGSPQVTEVETENLGESESQEVISGSEVKSFTDFKNEVENAVEGSTIRVSGKYVGNETILIEKNLTVIGDDDYTYFDASGESSIFYVMHENNVTFKNLYIMNGNSYLGGAAYLGTFINCIFYNCTADSAGALYYSNAYNCTFISNSAHEDGGAVGKTPVYNCKFINNSAAKGGAIWLEEIECCEISNCEFYNNSAEKGGAIYINKNNVKISDSLFENNTAKDIGGAIYLPYDGYEVSNCTFVNNKAQNFGGAIYLYYRGLNVYDSKFIKNAALNYHGGAVYTDFGDADIYNSYFESNAAEVGGALCYVSAHNCIFKENVAGQEGGGMYSGGAYDCNFTDNSPDDYSETVITETIKGQITLTQSGSYFGDKTLKVKVINLLTNKPASGVQVTLKFSNDKTVYVTTDSNGIATYNIPFNPSTYSVTASMAAKYNATEVKLSNIVIKTTPAKISLKSLKTNYNANNYFKIKVINTQTNKGIPGVKLLLKVYTGKKYKKVYVTTDSNGIAKYNAAKLKIGTHKVVVSIETSQASAKASTSKITVKKAYLKVVASNTKVKYKKSKKYTITVVNKHNNKPVKGIKVKVKVKSKVFNLKTNKKGAVSFNTASLAKGTYKVVITALANSNFIKGSLKTKIKVS